ncbi:MAG TPA: NERD domain-containing protein [Candidatus Omnitrophota bacterium]|nr:NERD domain-containing protein [Candidatus Omnitrophota bacterium]
MPEFIIPLVFICVLCLILFRIFTIRWTFGEAGVARKLESLQRKNKEYHPFNNIILKTPDGTTQIDHILISPYGVFVIETKSFKGWIFGDAHQKRWTQSLFGPYRSSIKYQFQNPIHQNYKHVKAVQDFLGIDSKSIFNLIVFAGYGEFMTKMPENVVGLYDLIPYIESHAEILFDSEKTNNFSRKLSDYVEHAPYNEESHMENLVQNMEHPICPKCGKPMILRTARKGAGAGSEFWGCPNFPSCRVTKNVL